MDTKFLKKYAPEARREFIEAVTNKAAVYGLLPKEILPMQEEGDVVIIGDRPFPRSVAKQRKELEDRIRRDGFQQFIEAIAYTWFNRFVAIRYMELHGYLDHGYRVLSHPEDKSTPEILENAERIELPGLNRDEVVDLKLDGGKDEQLYQMLLLAQCNALHKAMPFLFESIKDGTELLLPDNLLHTDSLVRTLVNDIPEEQWQNVEIIGWLYQFYISEKKDEVIGKVVKSEDIPAATQLFTPNWIVKYLVQNSLGRQWVATYPDSPLRQQMEFYIEPAEQTAEVQQQLAEITPDSLNPEELTLLDPACGSGHILVEAYDLFKAIYAERGYRPRDIPSLLLTKNLFGLEIDDRAAQLAAFALMMKARADDRGIFGRDVQPHVLSIQESKGLDAREVTDVLNEPILVDEPPPSGELFEEVADEKSPLFSRKNLSKEGDVSQADIAGLIELFEHGKTFGSLITVPQSLADRLPTMEQRAHDVLLHGNMFGQASAKNMLVLIRQARLLAGQHTAVVTNPPYMGSNGLNPLLRGYMHECYPDFKSDVFAAFCKRIFSLLKPNCRVGLVTPFVWMSLKTYRPVRHLVVFDNTLESLIRPEYHSFFDSAYVPLCAFVGNASQMNFQATFIDLNRFYGESEQAKRAKEAILDASVDWRFHRMIHHFRKTPGNVIAYSLNDAALSAFEESDPLSNFADLKQGLITGDNERFLRYWHEVDISDVSFRGQTPEATWYPYQKGGAFRKWYGNNEYVVNWRNDGEEIRALRNPNGRQKSRTQNVSFYFREGLTWTSLTISKLSMRHVPSGFIFADKGPMLFAKDSQRLFDILGYTNSDTIDVFLREVAPTMDYSQGPVGSVPFPADLDVTETVKQLVSLAKEDWDLIEESWDFSRCPILAANRQGSVEASFASFVESQEVRRNEVANHERAVNQRVEEAFGFAVSDNEVDGEEDSNHETTLYEPNAEEDTKRLFSYFIGCAMGRYSLDERGLIYAHSGNEGFDPSKYTTFPADEDGIIPITDTAWFPDDAANRFEQFVKTAWPEERLEENLTFIAESLGKKKGETSRDCIRRYLATGFYKHHMSMYKKRPIYWLFSSGKQRAFQCLVYLHRYNAGTLARMRTEYVVKLQGKINARIEQLEHDIPAASSTSHRKKLEKERDTLVKQRDELQEFDEKLRHYADRRIELDLDDGVKVNYGKFGDLLADVKSITGKKPVVEVTA